MMIESLKESNHEDNFSEYIVKFQELFIMNYRLLVSMLMGVILIKLILRIGTVKYYFAYSFFTSMVSLCCILCTPIAILRPKHPLNMIMTYPFACITSFVLGIDCELRRKDILAKDEAAVMVVNHQSSIDVLAHCRIMNVVKKCVIVSRRELIYFLPYYIFMTLCGSIFIDRKGGKSTSEILLNTCPTLCKYKSKLLIYPEGKRTLNAEKLKPFKQGGFRVAIKAQIPIIPTVIAPFYFIDSKMKCFRSGKMILKALDPIPTAGLTLDDIDSLIDKTWNVMSEEYEILKNEISELRKS